MNFKVILSTIFILFTIFLLVFYFAPFNTLNFAVNSQGSNFSILPGNQMQFYPNMRFPSNSISYKISDCPLQKEDDMEYAFRILENITMLSFYPVLDNEEIAITCEERNRINNGLFIAGEGGPINITVAGDLSVITYGEILLIRKSECSKPNVALHELFHVLGFEHSTNPENIMYNVTDCNEIIGDDMIELINELYSIPSYPDLYIQNVSAIMKGRFLDVNITVVNGGLNKAQPFKVILYANENIIDTIDFEEIDIGYGKIVNMRNIWVSEMNINELEFVIDSSDKEIDKENNKIKLEIKI
ncbi:matrixin family metalloprotease [Candidatus Pacearchaeota archaeon]|nr:matrixin family metalloprotease [Candidatus Pacearchaeota archaeon]